MKKKLILLALPLLLLCLNATLFAQKHNKTMPYAIIEGAKYFLISKENLMKLDSLYCSDNQFKIISFSSDVKRKGDIEEVKSNSNLITLTMRKMFSSVETGNKIWFENIKAKDSDGKVIILNSMSLKVK